MSQIIGTGDGKFLTFDSCWRDNGADATYAMVGGTKVIIKAGERAKPEIYQRGEGFYYRDGSPVDDKEHVAWLPKKFREAAEKFIESNIEKAKPLQPAATREAAVADAVKRGRGRPKKAKPAGSNKLEIKDAASYDDVVGPEVE